jgi:hypothetical protein
MIVLRVTAAITLLALCATSAFAQGEKDWEARAIAGFHQAGAASADFTQNFFFDFFIMRALSEKPLWDARVNIWGDIRVASSPQQITTPVANFVTGFADQVSKVPVNELAQGADFESGLEIRAKTWERDSKSTERMIGFVAYFGALGIFHPPSTTVQIFAVPDKTSPQYPLFATDYPSAANSKYIGFLAPDRDRFYRNYGFGVRITTFDKGHNFAPPATYMFALGQDEVITGGELHSLVGHFDVFYPLPISGDMGKYKCVYLFGTANLRLSRATKLDTFVLQNPNASSLVVQGFDPNVAIVTVPSTRDTYRIGVGVDLVNLIHSICNTAKSTC